MTEGQQTAAVENLKSSVIFNLMSRIVLNEQVLVSSTSLPRGMGERQLNNFFARDLESLVGTYRQTEIQTVFGLKGMCLQFDGYLSGVYVPPTPPAVKGENVVGITSSEEFFCTGVALESSRVAPPCTANATLTQLAPLLAGASLGEYSSQLRVKTFSTDIDLMVRVSSIAMNNIQSQQGYSFCLPLVKAMGYTLQHVQLFGSEVNSIIGDVYWRPSNPQNEYTQLLRRFPLECLTGEEIWNGHAWNKALFAVVSESDFIKSTVGIVQVSNWEGFAPQYWGTTCAVVFIPGNDTSNQTMNSVRMLSQLAYPSSLLSIEGNYVYFSRNGAGLKAETKVQAVKKAGLTRIPGPTKVVLFVIMGAREASSAGLVIGDGTMEENHFIELNAIDNGPITPYEAPEGDSPLGWAAVNATSQSSLTTWMNFIKEWELLFGNASDRSSAMRFWADHSMLFTNNFFCANGLDVGADQKYSFHTWADPNTHGEPPNVVISPYQQFTDQPMAWINSAKHAAGNTHVAIMQSCKTATLLPVGQITAADGNTSPWKWVNGQPPDASRLPYEDPIMTFLVYKKWINPNEEYPEVSLDDIARFGHTITVMANIMAGIVDLTAQQRDFTYTECMFPPLVLQVVPMALMRAKNVLWPALEEILTSGIQFAQYWNNRDATIHCYMSLTYWRAAAPLVAPDAVVNGTVMAGLARIPCSILGQWFSPLYPQYIQLRLNLPVMRPQRNIVTVGNVSRTMFQAEYSEEGTGLPGKLLAPISWLMWRLSLGVILGPQPVNNGWLVQATNNQGVMEYYVHMEQPDASRNQVLAREYNDGHVTIPPTTKISLPIGEFILKRSLGIALQPFNLLMQGPRDAFIGVGTGSTAYQMFTQTNTPQAIFVSETWATIPDWLFSPAGLQSNRDTI